MHAFDGRMHDLENCRHEIDRLGQRIELCRHKNNEQVLRIEELGMPSAQRSYKIKQCMQVFDGRMHLIEHRTELFYVRIQRYTNRGR
jgi:hypothetical protein